METDLLHAIPGGSGIGISSFNNPTGNPFDNASNFLLGGQTSVGGLNHFVRDQIDKAIFFVNQASIQANAAILKLENFNITIPDGSKPKLPLLDFSFNNDRFSSPPIPCSFPTIPDYDLGDPPIFEGDRDIIIPPIPDFNPPFTSIHIPPAPTYRPPAEPGAVPLIPEPNFPTAPIFVDPQLPSFQVIVIPDPPDIIIPAFDPVYPDFDVQQPLTGIIFSETEYSQEIIDNAITQIETFLAGGTGITPAVQDLIFFKASEREDRIATQAIQEVTDAYSNRGYIIPPGLMQKRVDAIRTDRNLKKQSISRDVLVKTMDAEIENLRFAVTAGIQAEELFVNIHLAAQDRAFQVARATVEYALQLYGIQVTIFNAQNEQVRIQAAVYEAQIRAALVGVEIFKAQIDGELAKVQLDIAKVELYKQQIVAIKTFVEKYEVEVRAEATKLEASAIRVRAFAETVNVYVAQIEAQKAIFDAYESQVKGEASKAGIIESFARAYAAEVDGITTGVTAEARVLEAEGNIFGHDIRAYQTRSEILKDKAIIQLSALQAGTAIYQADTQRYVAQTGREEALSRIELAAWEGGLRNQIEFYRTELSRWDIQLRTIIEQARLGLTAIEASGQLATTIIGGGLAAMHVGASLSGSGNISANGTLSDSYSTSKSISDNFSTESRYNQSITHSVDHDGANPVDLALEPPWANSVPISEG